MMRTLSATAPRMRFATRPRPAAAFRVRRRPPGRSAVPDARPSGAGIHPGRAVGCTVMGATSFGTDAVAPATGPRAQTTAEVPMTRFSLAALLTLVALQAPAETTQQEAVLCTFAKSVAMLTYQKTCRPADRLEGQQLEEMVAAHRDFVLRNTDLKITQVWQFEANQKLGLDAQACMAQELDVFYTRFLSDATRTRITASLAVDRPPEWTPCL